SGGFIPVDVLANALPPGRRRQFISHETVELAVPREHAPNSSNGVLRRGRLNQKGVTTRNEIRAVPAALPRDGLNCTVELRALKRAAVNVHPEEPHRLHSTTSARSPPPPAIESAGAHRSLPGRSRHRPGRYGRA